MTYREIRNRLSSLYGDNEGRAIADLLLCEMFGLSKADVLCGAVEQLSSDNLELLGVALERLMRSEPVQYVIGHADFCSRRFNVDKNVLIPRPETEELCSWIVSGNKTTTQAQRRILDVGTGSGCIACTLALELPHSYVEAWDISPAALDVAGGNAAALKAPVVFRQRDALNAIADGEQWDVIVSNPPYVCDNERSTMERNVIDYEPHTALFVPDDDPLLFYRAIAHYASSTLSPNGQLYFEINPLYSDETVDMLRQESFVSIDVKKDEYGKLRMVRAIKQ